jgi:predicted ATPase/DNA-binding SARP family transcriptional activator
MVSGGRVEFGVLGPLEARLDGELLRLGGGKQRAVLAVLLLHANEPVSVDRLVDALWQESPPQSAGHTIQVYLSALRKVLGRLLIVRGGGGYRIELGPGQLDLERLETLLAAGREALREGRAAEAREALVEARGLWRGPPLSEFAYEPFAQVAIGRLEELRLLVAEEAVEADLALGRHHELIADLEALTGDHPLRERLRGQLMLALYRSGRQADALAAYQSIRGLLADELGVEPGPPLKELERQILRHDPELAAPERQAQPSPGLVRLPPSPTSFVGRERELAEVIERLTDSTTRMLTLTGPGGTGKTRLAVQAAAEAAASFPDGVVWVPLAPLRDPGLVLSAVAAALGIKEKAGMPLPETIAGLLGERRMLILVDNAEHLLPQVATDLAEISTQLAESRLVVTCRERLQLQVETVWPVPPLSESDAERLFVARARAVGVEVEMDETVRELCRRLDELPLALELAAARLVLFDPPTLLEQLPKRLDLLKGARDADPRQQTLRATIDWSYQLLDGEEQRVYRALSVFAGGCTLGAAEHVADTDADTIQSLLDKSLLRRRGGYHGPRYWMLETIREHAIDELAAHGETDTLSDRHADWMLDQLDEAGPRDDVEFSPVGYETLALDEIDNLRVAIPRMTARDPSRAAALAGVVGLAWAATPELREGLEIVRTMYAADDDPPVGSVMAAEAALGYLTCLVADIEQSLRHTRRAIDDHQGPHSGFWRGLALITRALARTMTVPHRASGEGRPLAEEALRLARERGQPFEIASALNMLGFVSASAGELSASQRFYEEGANLARARGYMSLEVNALSNLGSIALQERRFEDAEAITSVVLREFHAAPVEQAGGLAHACRAFAQSIAGRRDSSDAARLIASVDRELERSGIFEDPTETELRDAALERIAADIGTDELETALNAGSKLPFGQAMRLALELAHRHGGATAGSAPEEADDGPARGLPAKPMPE